MKKQQGQFMYVCMYVCKLKKGNEEKKIQKKY